MSLPAVKFSYYGARFVQVMRQFHTYLKKNPGGSSCSDHRTGRAEQWALAFQFVNDFSNSVHIAQVDDCLGWDKRQPHVTVSSPIHIRRSWRRLRAWTWAKQNPGMKIRMEQSNHFTVCCPFLIGTH